MKRTIVKIKSDFNKNDVFCEVDGMAIELIGAYMALTENLIESFSREGDYGVDALRMLRRDANKIFDVAGIFEKDCDKND